MITVKLEIETDQDALNLCVAIGTFWVKLFDEARKEADLRRLQLEQQAETIYGFGHTIMRERTRAQTMGPDAYPAWVARSPCPVCGHPHANHVCDGYMNEERPSKFAHARKGTGRQTTPRPF